MDLRAILTYPSREEEEERKGGGAQEHLKSSEDLERDLEPHFTLEEEEEGERRGAPTEPWLVKWHSHFFFSFSPS